MAWAAAEVSPLPTASTNAPATASAAELPPLDMAWAKDWAMALELPEAEALDKAVARD
jgi:hypothetical protein